VTVRGHLRRHHIEGRLGHGSSPKLCLWYHSGRAVELANKGAYTGNCLSHQRTARPRPARVSDGNASQARATVENCCDDIREVSGITRSVSSVVDLIRR